MPDDWGYYPYACEEADLVFRVQRKDASGWRTVYSDSSWVYTSTGLKGSDITRLYISFFRSYKYYGGLSKNRYHRVQRDARRQLHSDAESHAHALLLGQVPRIDRARSV